MRSALIGLVAAFAGLASASQAAGPTLSVPIDQSARVSLPVGTRDVMIGNPAIADVNVLDQRSAVVLGKGYGVTNLLVIDQLGRTVMERQIVVSAPNLGRVSVIRGPRIDDYACASGCERTTPAGGATETAAPPTP